MTRTFSPHMEMLPHSQQQLWPDLRPVRDLGFVLYGGTAIALHLGHRSSVDFDFFSERPLELVAIRAAVPLIGRSLVIQEDPETLSVQVLPGRSTEESVNVSFFGRIEFGRVSEPLLTDDETLLVASLNDLMATKLKVLLQRIEAKDYLDIAAMIESGMSLENGLASARAMYGPAFQPSESLKAMVYFEGGDLLTLSTGVKETLVNAVRHIRTLPKAQIMSRSLSS